MKEITTEQKNWIDADIATPKEDGDVLTVIVGYGKNPTIDICTYSRTRAVSWAHQGWGNLNDHVKYWMPLPSLPESLHNNNP